MVNLQGQTKMNSIYLKSELDSIRIFSPNCSQIKFYKFLSFSIIIQTIEPVIWEQITSSKMNC